ETGKIRGSRLDHLEGLCRGTRRTSLAATRKARGPRRRGRRTAPTRLIPACAQNRRHHTRLACAGLRLLRTPSRGTDNVSFAVFENHHVLPPGNPRKQSAGADSLPDL